MTKSKHSKVTPTAVADELARASETVLRFLALAGIEDPQLIADAERLLTKQVAAVNQLGLREPDLAVIGQAYIRAIGRVGAAEDEALSRLRDTSPVGAATQVTELADALRVLGRDVFDVLHRSHLSRLIAGDSQSVDRSRRSQQPTAVAHVDVIASTELLQGATQIETERLVDGLFSSAQVAIRGRGVEATKYVGDGVFLVGLDPTDVAVASLAEVAGSEVVRKLREADRLLSEGTELPEVFKHLEIAEATYHRWRNQYGGMKADDVKRLKELEAENQRLKRIVADQVLENQALREVNRGNW